MILVLSAFQVIPPDASSEVEFILDIQTMPMFAARLHQLCHDRIGKEQALLAQAQVVIVMAQQPLLDEPVKGRAVTGNGINAEPSSQTGNRYPRDHTQPHDNGFPESFFFG